MSARSITVAVFAVGALAASAAPVADGPERHEFVFARLAYPQCSGWEYWQFKSWQTDFPKADVQLLMGLERLTMLDAYPKEHAVLFGTNELNRFPFLYAAEVGYFCLTSEQILELRRYLQAGGFLFVDDFWGTVEWDQFTSIMEQVVPRARLEQLSTDHPVFHQVFDVDEIVQVPNVEQGMQGGPTFEKDGYVPQVWGYFDEHDRLMVLAMHNTDLGDAWEWAENPYYPLKYGNYAYKMAVDVVVYAMSH